MPEHLIRLRAAWAGTWADDPMQSRRVDLPARWGVEGPAPSRLARGFRLPRIDPATERAFVRLRSVPGLLGVRLGGEVVECVPPGEGVLEFPLPPGLEGPTRLELELDPLVASGAEAPWGEIGLLIRGTEPA